MSPEERFVIKCKLTFYQCPDCLALMRTADELLRHYKTHYNAFTSPIRQKQPEKYIRFMCSLCFVTFPVAEEVRKHMVECHNCIPIQGDTQKHKKSKPDNQNCNEPSPEELQRKEGGTSRPISLKTLKSRLKKTFTFKCSSKGCLYSFESETSLEIHRKCHVSPDLEHRKQFRCSVCSWDAPNWRACSTHLWTEHGINVDLMTCPLCPFKAGLSITIFRHLQIHQPTKGYACSECSSQFPLFSQLRAHAIQHKELAALEEGLKYKAPERWYSSKKCDVCGNLFSNAKTLSKHIKVVHNKIKPYICTVCGHKTARKQTWQVHMRQHTGEKPFSCDICGFRAADPGVVRKHRLRHLESDGKPYKCPDCPYVAIQSSSLKAHLRKYHPKSFNAMTCDSCNFISINDEILRRHKQEHLSGVRQSNDDPSEPVVNHKSKTSSENLAHHLDISSDSFLPMESADSLTHEPPLDTGGVTIPATNTDEAQCSQL